MIYEDLKNIEAALERHTSSNLNIGLDNLKNKTTKHLNLI